MKKAITKEENLISVDCGKDVKKRKACKNCTCGLAEELDAGKISEAPKTSACGNVSAVCCLIYTFNSQSLVMVVDMFI